VFDVMTFAPSDESVIGIFRAMPTWLMGTSGDLFDGESAPTPSCLFNAADLANRALIQPAGCGPVQGRIIHTPESHHFYRFSSNS
jgi:hypothetical protein